MAATQIRTMNSAHDRILDFILANPCAGLRELAAETGYSVCWLSQIIRSDIFQTEYAARREGIESAVMQPIHEKLNAVAALALDRVEEILRTTENNDTIIDAFDKVMVKTGYAQPRPGQGNSFQQNNFFHISKEDLAQGRAVMQGNVVQLPVPQLAGLKDVSEGS